MKIKLIAALILCLPAFVAARPDVSNFESHVADTVAVDGGYSFSAEQMPTFMNGDIHTFLKWVVSQIKYPQKKFSEGIHGTVVVTFVVDEKGAVKQVEAISSPDEELTKVVIKAVKQSPRWEPGRNGNKPVVVRMTLPVRFGMPEAQRDSTQTKFNEEMPKFMGGDINYFGKWVAAHVRYPKKAAELGIQGKVVVTFAVDRDGSIVDVSIMKSSNIIFNLEAVRVVMSSPKWTPGKLDGKPVKIELDIPINFRLMADPPSSHVPPSRRHRP